MQKEKIVKYINFLKNVCKDKGRTTIFRVVRVKKPKQLAINKFFFLVPQLDFPICRSISIFFFFFNNTSRFSYSNFYFTPFDFSLGHTYNIFVIFLSKIKNLHLFFTRNRINCPGFDGKFLNPKLEKKKISFSERI